MLKDTARSFVGGVAILVAIVVVGLAVWTATASSGGQTGAAGHIEATPPALAPTSGLSDASAAPVADPPNCTIDAMTAEYGIRLKLGDGPSADNPAVRARIAGRFPSGEIAEQASGLATSPTAPDVDGHHVLVYRVRGATVPQPAGPPGGQVGPLTRACTITIYDGNTGDFLADLIDSWP